jgi:hypothetical protein
VNVKSMLAMSPLRSEHYPQLFQQHLVAGTQASAESGDEQGQGLQSTPHRPHPRLTVPFAVEMAAQTANPQHRLTDR